MRTGLVVLLKTICALLFAVSITDFVYVKVNDVSPISSDVEYIDEEFDPSLLRLSSEKELEDYIRLQYQLLPPEKQDSVGFALLTQEIIRKRFYHGNLTYKADNNFLAWGFAHLTGRTYNEIWIPDHILKSDKALCGQQSIVMMSILKRNGFPVRAVYFNHPRHGGHFSLEAYYSGDWHFFDPDLEPDADILLSRNRPSIEELVKDTTLLVNAYHHREPELIIELLNTYSYGRLNQLMSTRIIAFQQITFGLSQSLWLFIMVIYLFVKRSVWVRSNEEAFV